MSVVKKVVSDDNPFHSDQVSVLHSEAGFVIDFRRSVPQLDIGEQGEVVTLVTHHRLVLLSPVVAKSLVKVLRDSVDKYEKSFGKIKLPKQKKRPPVNSKNQDKYIG